MLEIPGSLAIITGITLINLNKSGTHKEVPVKAEPALEPIIPALITVPAGGDAEQLMYFEESQ